MSIISDTENSLLISHNVQISVESRQYGLITIGERSFKVSICLFTQGEKASLSEEQMIETAKKVAVILLKKELINAQAAGSNRAFTIDAQSIKESIQGQESATSTKEMKHSEEKDTSREYAQLEHYLLNERSIASSLQSSRLSHQKKPAPPSTFKRGLGRTNLPLHSIIISAIDTVFNSEFKEKKGAKTSKKKSKTQALKSTPEESSAKKILKENQKSNSLIPLYPLKLPSTPPPFKAKFNLPPLPSLVFPVASSLISELAPLAYKVATYAAPNFLKFI